MGDLAAVATRSRTATHEQQKDATGRSGSQSGRNSESSEDGIFAIGSDDDGSPAHRSSPQSSTEAALVEAEVEDAKVSVESDVAADGLVCNSSGSAVPNTAVQQDPKADEG